MPDYKSIIPQFFFKGDCKERNATTVGELKALLAQLPDGLPVQGSFGDSVSAVVYNVQHEDAHLQIVDHDSDEDGDEQEDEE